MPVLSYTMNSSFTAVESATQQVLNTDEIVGYIKRKNLIAILQ